MVLIELEACECEREKISKTLFYNGSMLKEKRCIKQFESTMKVVLRDLGVQVVHRVEMNHKVLVL